MCAHMRVWWKKKKEGGGGVYERTLIPAPPPRDELGLHLVDTLFPSGIEVDSTEARRGIQRGGRTERKGGRMCVVLDSFWTVWVSRSTPHRRWRTMSFFHAS